SRASRTDDQALETRDVKRGASQAASGVDESVRVEVGRESAEDDAQDHLAGHSTRAQTAAAIRSCTILVHKCFACYGRRRHARTTHLHPPGSAGPAGDRAYPAHAH